MKPSVSVITPTWQRHKLLLEHCIPSVINQTYDNFEYIIASDGPDPLLKRQLDEQWDDIRYIFLPTHPVQSGWGTYARIEAEAVAHGDIIAQVDDDDRLRPQHLELLVEALESESADFAYGMMERHSSWGSSDVVGQEPPVYSQVTSALVYRKELSKVATWRSDQETIDWDLVKRWVAAGASWAFVSVITVDGYPSVWRY